MQSVAYSTAMTRTKSHEHHQNSAGDLPAPIAVFLQVGGGLHFWINLLLTLLGGLPGVVHALWLIVNDK